MSQDQVLLMCPIYPPTQQRIEAGYQVHRYWTAPDPAALLAQIAPACRVVVTSGSYGIDAGTLAKLPHAELISCFGVGVDAIDLDYCRGHGIAVTNTPEVLTDDVADLAVGLMLAVLRKIPEGDRFVRAGRWLRGGLALATAVSGRRVGIVGMGRIGQAIADRLRAFKVEIGYHGPNRKQVPDRYFPDLVAMAEWADVVIAACPGGAATRHIVSARVIEALGPQGVFINIARGSVVDQAALVAALVAGKLGGAGLDVFDDEPNAPAELFALDSVVLQPHVGSASAQTRQQMGDLTAGNVDAYFAKQPLLTPVVPLGRKG
ncbi:MAG: 2-hydroxyacid dehydrogenase [Lautropia sp.]